jgi:hypothetical protein
MLHRRNKADPPPHQERDGLFNDSWIKIHQAGFVDDIRVLQERGMPEVDEHIGIGQEVEGKVTGAVTGITADDNRKPLLPESLCNLHRLPFQAGRELEGYTAGVPVPEPLYQVRSNGQ